MEPLAVETDLGGPGERRLRALVHADVVGYSRLIGMNDAGTVRRLRTLRRALIDPAIRSFRGQIVNTAGDSMMIVFDSVDGAMRCAMRVQQQVPVLDGDQPPERRIRFRVGINIGDVIADATDIHGDGPNIAARLQSICPVGGICVSRAVRDHVGARLGLEFEPLGPLTLKNIAQPVEAFALRLDPDAPARSPAERPRRWKRVLGKRVLAAVGVLLLAAAGVSAWWLQRDGPSSVAEATRPPPASVAARPGASQAPRLSLVVLPFDNFDIAPEQNAFVDGITEDLTTALAQKFGLLVTARNSAFSYKGKPIDIKRAGDELGVRYVVEGSVRKAGGGLRLTTQLIAAETGAHLWAYHVDLDGTAGGASLDEVIWRISTDLYRRLIEIEGARGARERPGNPDATDVLLQAFALHDRAWSPQQMPELIALYERAAQLDPSSAAALGGLAWVLLDALSGFEDQAAPATFERVAALIEQSESLRRRNFFGTFTTCYLLQYEGRGPEAMAACRNLTEIFPNSGIGYHMLGSSLLFTGRFTDALANEQQSIRLDPRSPSLWIRYRRIAQASLFLSRYDDAVGWEQRALAAVPGAVAGFQAARYAEIAAAHAFAGRTEEARAAAAESDRLSPTMTLRNWGFSFASYGANPVLGAQIARVQEGMRLAGVRDHAEEEADFGVVSDDALHTGGDGVRTPVTAPGARTVRTADLVVLLEQRKPLLVDVNAWGKSIPGAIGLAGAGIGGSTSDSFQARLGRKMKTLTHGDLRMPVVTMAWNANRFGGRNLALRLVALGYSNVLWYRGGREAWEVAGQPEAEVTVQPW